MLVVLETFCELQQLKQLRKMFYLKKEKPHDRLAILEHDQLSFTTVSNRATVHNEDKTQPFVSVPTLASPNDDPMIQSPTPSFPKHRHCHHHRHPTLPHCVD
ncbi:hypothetical protein INR49_009869, partial [Caranx melampygus]